MNTLLRLERIAPTLREAARVVIEPVPVPGPGQVLVRHHYLGINGFFDWLIARDELPYRTIVPPCDLGVEAVGTVIALGAGVTGLEPGDAVATSRFGTGYREFAAVDAVEALPIPSPMPEFVALRTTAVSGLVALERVGGLTTGEVVLVTAAAGGLGQFVVQLAKLAGNHVIGVASGPEKMALLGELGCDRTIDRSSDDVSSVLAAEYPAGINLVLDAVGGPLFDTLVAHLAVRGRLVVAGLASDLGPGGPEVVMAPRVYHHLYWKSASVRAFQNAFYPDEQKPAFERLLRLYADGKLRVVIDPTDFRGIGSIYDAVDHLVTGKTIGKVVIDVRPQQQEGQE